MTNPSALPVGSTLQSGKYRIEKMLGQGGFGITYVGYQVNLNRRVAIKEFFMKDYCSREDSYVSVANTETARKYTADFRAKFIKEAQTIAQFNNPHIIRIHDVFQENGTAYYVMEHIEGGSLADLLDRRGRLSEREALTYIRQIGDALSYIHKRNVLHLDVKPQNVLLNQDGEAVLIDFGVSKRYDDEGGQTSSTPVGLSHGYAPIEQYDQNGLSNFAPCTDVYSLGAVCYKLLTGATPPRAFAVDMDGLSFPPFVDGRLQAVISKAMSPRRKDRWQTVGEMMAALDGEDPDATKVEVVVLPQPEPPKPQPKPQPEHRPEPPHPIDPTPHRSNDKYIFFTIAAAVVVGLIVWFASNKREPVVEEPDEKEEVVPQEEVVQEVHPVVQATPSPAVSTSTTGKIKGHEYVDLGLSVKWATCNVWASSPEEYGNYYAWGETSPAPGRDYSEANCRLYGKSVKDIGGNSTYDAARANWGGSWRLPTKAEFQELIDNCTWKWTTQGGKRGYKVTSKENGASIFLPAAGSRYGTSLYYDGQYGYYWTSTPYESYTYYASSLYFISSSHSTNWDYRDYGFTVRPVAE